MTCQLFLVVETEFFFFTVKAESTRAHLGGAEGIVLPIDIAAIGAIVVCR
jgi:hypothetical protein